MLLNAANAPPEGDGLPLDDGEVVRPLLEVLAVLGLDVHLGEVDGGRGVARGGVGQGVGHGGGFDGWRHIQRADARGPAC